MFWPNRFNFAFYHFLPFLFFLVDRFGFCRTKRAQSTSRDMLLSPRLLCLQWKNLKQASPQPLSNSSPSPSFPSPHLHSISIFASNVFLSLPTWKKSTILCETFFYTVLFPFCRVLTDVCLIILECTVPFKCRLALLFLGSIVFQGSISSFLGQPNCATYATMKGAIVQLARNCAYDFAKYGIRVNTVCAGTVETPISVHERAEQGW